MFHIVHNNVNFIHVTSNNNFLEKKVQKIIREYKIRIDNYFGTELCNNCVLVQLAQECQAKVITLEETI